MKKFLVGLFILLGVLVLAHPILAEGEPGANEKSKSSLKNAIANQNDAFGGDKGAGYGRPSDARLIAASGIQVFLSFMGTLFSIYTVYAGFIYMTSAGNEEKITKARGMITHGVIGVAVIFMSYTIVYFIYKSVIFAQADQFGTYFKWGTIPPGTQQVEGPDPLTGNSDPLEQLVPTPDNPNVKNLFFKDPAN